MKKFVNNVDNILVESLSGFENAHNDILKVHLTPNFITFLNSSNANPNAFLVSSSLKLNLSISFICI